MEFSPTASRLPVPPGPSNAWWGLGNMVAMQGTRILSFFERMATYGNVAYCTLGPYQMYLFNHPDLVHELLVEKDDKFQHWSVQKRVMKPILGNGTVVSDGAYWKQQRKLVQPAFHTKRIQSYVEIMVRELTALIDSWEPDREYDLTQEMQKVTMAIITQIMFGAEVKGREAEISHALSVCLDTEMRQMQALVTLPAWVPTPSHVAFRRAIEIFDNLIYGFINERRKSMEDRGDLLSMLLLAADDNHRMTDQEVRDEAVTMFSAGFETSANTLDWTWVLLSQHPEVEVKLADEIRRVLGDRPPTMENIRQLPYGEMVLKEVLRVYPPACAIMREASEEVTIGGYTLPKGSIAVVSQHILHRDPRFVKEPDRFMPERFAAENESDIPRYAYFPFGAGPHICMGQALAMLEAQVILTMIIQRCHITLSPGQDLSPKITLIQRPSNGVKATIQRRN